MNKEQFQRASRPEQIADEAAKYAVSRAKSGADYDDLVREKIAELMKHAAEAPAHGMAFGRGTAERSGPTKMRFSREFAQII